MDVKIYRFLNEFLFFVISISGFVGSGVIFRAGDLEPDT